LNGPSKELSIVIPAYGECAQLPDLLRGILAEEVAREAEILVIDDGSPRPVEPSLREILAAFKDAQCVRKPNGGGPSARNFGADRAKGRRLLFIDQDLQLPRDFVATLVKVAEEFGPAAVSALYENRLESTSPFAEWYGIRARKWEEGGRQGSEIAPGVIEVHPVLLSSTSLLIDRPLYLQCGGMPVYPRTGVEDQALGLLLGRIGARVLRTDRVKPLHVEERADLPRFCARQKEGSAATVRLVSSFPEVFGTLADSAQHRAHGPIRPLRESPSVSLKKLAKTLVAGLARPVFFPLVARLEHSSPRSWLLDRLYSAMVAAHLQAGWREGLALEPQSLLR
jgi:hypothetical protein